MRWKQIDCDFEYEGSSYGAMGDVHVRTESKDIGPEGFLAHRFAEVPVEASVDNLQVFDAHGDRMVNPTPELIEMATGSLEDKAAMLTWEMA